MRVVFVAGHEFNGNNLNGGRQGSRKLYDLWATAVGKENVYVLMPSNTEYETDMEHIFYFKTHHNKLEQMKNAIFLRNGYNRRVEKEIVKYINKLQPDILYFDHSNIGLLLKKVTLPCESKVYVFMHNIEHDYVWNKVKNESILYYLPYLSFWKNERYIVQNADVVMNLNERDARRLEELYSRKSDYLIPVSYTDVFDINKVYLNKKSEVCQLLFVGAYAGPNIQGIEWFIEKVLPFLPNCLLNIVGMNMEKLRDTICNKYINVIGTVEDTSSYYYSADIVVIPLLYGAGMKTKTAEAMMYGKQIVATNEALEGYDIDDLEDVYRANSDKEFIKTINEIKEKENKYSEAIRNKFLEKYCTESLKEYFSSYITGEHI